MSDSLSTISLNPLHEIIHSAASIKGWVSVGEEKKVTTDIRNISNPCREGHLHTLQSVLQTDSEQVFFNQGFQVLVCEIFCFRGTHAQSEEEYDKCAVLWNPVLISK